MESKLTKRQEKKWTKDYTEAGRKYRIIATARFDDRCGNGHNDFSITGDIYEILKPGRLREYRGGCIHDEIKKHFPELAHLIKWHLCSTDGPMHYIANTTYHASNKDCWGKRKGEPKRYKKEIYFGKHPFPYSPSKSLLQFVEEVGPHNEEWESMRWVAVAHPREPQTFKPKFTLVRMQECKWHECPFDDEAEAKRFCAAMSNGNAKIVSTPTDFGEGKEPDLEAARACAVWPDATLEQLQDKESLEARLPMLIESMRKDIEEIGFTW